MSRLRVAVVAVVAIVAGAPTAVIGGGLQLAAGAGGGTAVRVVSPSASPTVASTPPPVVHVWVRVAAAGVWKQPTLVRRVDRPALTSAPNLRAWVRGQSIGQRLALANILMTQALRGERLTKLGERNPGRGTMWDEVAVDDQRGSVYPHGIVGWVPAAQLSPTPVQPPSAAKLAVRGRSIVHAAAGYLGTPYIFAGMTHAGIDCSGLTYEALARVGVTLPRDAADQSRHGRPVARNRLRPGDLVFFGTGSWQHIHHVAIYIGGGKVLHAPHTGSRVQITKLSAFGDYWGARRIVAAS